MLPDFIAAKAEAHKSLMTIFRAVVNSEPLVANTTRRRIFEGDQFTIGDSMGDFSTSEFEHVQSETSVSHEDIIEKGVGAYLEALKKPAEEMQAAQAKMMLRELDKAVTKTGNSVDAGGEFTFDTFIEAISKIEIAFTPDGAPQLPSLFVHPEMGARIATLNEQWEQNPEYQKRMSDLMQQKKAEWDDFESHRRLVD